MNGAILSKVAKTAPPLISQVVLKFFFWRKSSVKQPWLQHVARSRFQRYEIRLTISMKNAAAFIIVPPQRTLTLSFRRFFLSV